MSNPDPGFPAIYEQLRHIARQKLAELPPGQTLQATALVHEAWLRLAGAGSELEFEDPSHLRAATAQAMRWILVDRARRRTAQKRSSGAAIAPEAPLAAEAIVAPEAIVASEAEQDQTDWLRLDAALSELEQLDPRRSKVVLLRYFAGLSVEDTASAMDLSPATVKRDWQFARAWLLRAMGAMGAMGPASEES